MHDHTLTFKADLDILGTANTFVTHTIVPTTEKYVWSNTTRSTMKLQRGNISNEDESKLVSLTPADSEQVSALTFSGRSNGLTMRNRCTSSRTSTRRTSTGSLVAGV